jgi:hypothetical protein
LYLNKLELDTDYQDSTLAGAQAIRSLLCDTLLHSRWSLVVYVPDIEVHFNDDDRRKAREHAMRDREAFIRGHTSDQADTDEDESRALHDWIAHRVDALAQKDMRQFFRSGFQQVAELVHDSDCYYMFAVPTFLEGRSVMVSHVEALSLPIATRTAKPVESPQGVDHDLLEFMKEQPSKRKCKTDLPLGIRTRGKEGKYHRCEYARHFTIFSRDQIEL